MEAKSGWVKVKAGDEPADAVIAEGEKDEKEREAFDASMSKCDECGDETPEDKLKFMSLGKRGDEHKYCASCFNEMIADLDMDKLMELAGVGSDGMAVFEDYIHKYFKQSGGADGLREAIEAWKNDVEEYAMPSVDKMIEILDELEQR